MQIRTYWRRANLKFPIPVRYSSAHKGDQLLAKDRTDYFFPLRTSLLFRIAKKFSAYTIGTVGNASKVGLLEAEGYDEIIVRNGHFRKKLANTLNGRQLDLIMDAVGGKVQKDSFDLLATTGRMVAYGLSQFASPGARPNYLKLALRYITMPRYHTLTLIESNKSILGFNLIWLYDRVDLLQSMLSEIQALRLKKPYVGAVFPFDQLKDAVCRFQSGRTTGKVVVTTSDNRQPS